MALRKKGQYWYGDSQADIVDELKEYGKANGYQPTQFAEAQCACANKTFRLRSDDEEGAAVRECVACNLDHPIGDSADYLAGATLDEHVCVCDGAEFEITVGVALYDGSQDVRWIYIGCRCVACGLVGTYADWKCEFPNFHELLARV